MDYTLLTSEERTAYVSSLDIDELDPEKLANYILHPETKFGGILNPNRTFEDAELDPNMSTAPPAKYTKPKFKIDYSLPDLQPFKQARDAIKLQIENATDNTHAYKLRKIAREISIDAGTLFHQLRNEIQPIPTTHHPIPINIEDSVDLSNSFHVKQLIKFYSDLKQSPDSQLFMEYFDTVVEATPLAPWEKHILIRKIDNASQITVGIELAEQFNRPISPSYLSQATKTIYEKIAETAYDMEVKWYWRNSKTKWRTCPCCGNKIFITPDSWNPGQSWCKKCNTKISKKGRIQ